MFQSSLRPSGFLNKLNPMSRTYQGYMQANQSLLEENEDDEAEDDDNHAGPWVPNARRTSCLLGRVLEDAGRQQGSG